jgi:hypothetical protein
MWYANTAGGYGGTCRSGQRGCCRERPSKIDVGYSLPGTWLPKIIILSYRIIVGQSWSCWTPSHHCWLEDGAWLRCEWRYSFGWLLFSCKYKYLTSCGMHALIYHVMCRWRPTYKWVSSWIWGEFVLDVRVPLVDLLWSSLSVCLYVVILSTRCIIYCWKLIEWVWPLILSLLPCFYFIRYHSCGGREHVQYCYI